MSVGSAASLSAGLALAPMPAAAQASEQTRIVQQALADGGYQPGDIDGLYGDMTKAAIEAFQRDAGLAVTGQITPGLVQQLTNPQPREIEITGKSGCFVLSPNPRPQETVEWDGACVSGRPDGEGTMVWRFRRNGAEAISSLRGTLVQGRVNGRAVYLAPDGSEYDGDWVDGKPNGQGAFRSAQGYVYEGGWRNGLPHGQGRWDSGVGDVFEGRWVDGSPDRS